ncbi:equilibrative nucleoside transporter 1-like [Uloborus diversus]|uniref:equilibrative nucleoside transporter 1-like n=1 Tax=Uloborus diversus TaxID=327109 RepID=UPI002409FCE1|nr:equilibrative nucleoside transporter 1-like [Uloborus diversus]
MSSSEDEKMREMESALASQQVVNYQATGGIPAKPDQQEPKDKYHIVRLTMYLFGITSLLPWNFFIQANDYWMYKFRNTSAPFDPASEDKTNLQTIFSSYLAIASKVPYVCFLLVNAYVSNRFLPSKRIQYPLLGMILLFLVTTSIVFVNTDKHQTAFFGITIGIVVAINSMCGFVQGGGTGIAGSLPKRYMGYNVNGMALGGMLASAAQILSLVGNTNPSDSACFYFATATVFLCITFGFFRLTLRSELYNFYMSKQTSMLKKRDRPADASSKRASNLEIFKKIWVYAISIVFVFWVTLAVLPAVVVLVLSTSTEDTIWTGRLFLPVACFLLFNTADLVSRLVALRIPIPSRFKHITLTLTILRAVFVPLLMLCNAHPRSHLPIVFDSDVDFIIIIVFFALTGGYLCSIALTQGPKQVKAEHNEQAGSQLAFFLGVGLMLGSVSSYGLVKWL